MRHSAMRVRKFVSLLLLSAALIVSQASFAQDHVISSSDLQKDLQTASANRQQQLAHLDRLFSSQQGQKALSLAHVNYQQIKTAVRTLSDEDLSRMASRAQQSQDDFAAGNITSIDLLWIVVGILVVILIIVAVRH